MRGDSLGWSTERAEEIARRAHANQTDKAQVPYARHVHQVARYASRVAELSGLDHQETDLVEQAAWLHDIVEDSEHTGYSFDRLRQEGVPDQVIELVDVLTKRDDEQGADGYDRYFARVTSNRLARIVKQADLADNLDPDRLAKLQPEKRQRLIKKYAWHWLVLTRPFFTEYALTTVEEDRALVEMLDESGAALEPTTPLNLGEGPATQ